MGRLGTKRRVQVHSAYHDAGRLADAVQSIKASFRQLDTSGAQLERSVARQRTRLLMHIMGARSQTLKETQRAAKAEIERKFGRNTIATVHAKAELQRRNSWVLNQANEDASSIASDEVLHSESSESEDGGSADKDYFLMQFSPHESSKESKEGRYSEVTVGSTLHSPTFQMPQGFLPTRDASSNGLGLSTSRGDAPSFRATFTSTTSATVSPRPSQPGWPCYDVGGGDGGSSNGGEAPMTARSRPGTATSTPRPCARVAANRPFSAPKVRWTPSYAKEAAGTAEPSRPRSAEKQSVPSADALGRHSTKATSATPRLSVPTRPCSAPSGGTKQAVHASASGGAGHRPRRPERNCHALHGGANKPGFGNLQRPPQLGARSTARERPPTIPLCEPQTRFMGLPDSARSVDGSCGARTTLPSTRPTSAPAGTRHLG